VSEPKKNDVVAVHQITSWSGPLPQPDHLKDYELVCPGAAKMVIEMAVKEAERRHELEVLEAKGKSENNQAYYKTVFRGQHYAFAVVALVLAAAAYCGYVHEAKLGMVIAGVGLANIAATFIGRKSSGK